MLFTFVVACKKVIIKFKIYLTIYTYPIDIHVSMSL